MVAIDITNTPIDIILLCFRIIVNECLVQALPCVSAASIDDVFIVVGSTCVHDLLWEGHYFGPGWLEFFWTS